MRCGAAVASTGARWRGFGPAVVGRLRDLPAGAEVLETGIGGIALLQELLAGCDGLVIVDAVDRGAEPGTVFELRPEVGDAVHVADVHLANPDRVLAMARTMGALPERVRIVGGEPAIEHAVGVVRQIVAAWLREPARAEL